MPLALSLRRSAALALLACAALTTPAHALFGDDEARRAIIDLRQHLDASNANQARLAQDNEQLRRNLVELQNQIETLRGDLARLRGDQESLARDLSLTQQRQTDLARDVQQSAAQSTPATSAASSPTDALNAENDPQPDPADTGAEKRDYDAALARFRNGDFGGAQKGFVAFLRQYPKSSQYDSALFWLGNAQYATRNYKEAITNFRSAISLRPNGPQASEALLAIANSQIELKDTKAARQTLNDVVRLHPQSEAAQAAKERLARLR